MDTAQTSAPASADERARLFSYQPAWKKSAVILSGVFVNFLIGWILLSAIFAVGMPPIVAVVEVQNDSPAAAAGFKRGDILRDYSLADDAIAAINASRGKELSFHIVRGGKELTIAATPRLVHPEQVGALGVRLAESGIEKKPLVNAAWEGLKLSGKIFWAITAGIGELFKNLFTQGKLAEDVVGPIGIFSIAQRSSEIGALFFLQLIALISINLAVVNLLPFPALDGGRFLMILAEAIKGSPLPRKAEYAINAAGFALVILLMLVLTVRDIINL